MNQDPSNTMLNIADNWLLDAEDMRKSAISCEDGTFVIDSSDMKSHAREFREIADNLERAARQIQSFWGQL